MEAGEEKKVAEIQGKERKKAILAQGAKGRTVGSEYTDVIL